MLADLPSGIRETPDSRTYFSGLPLFIQGRLLPSEKHQHMEQTPPWIHAERARGRKADPARKSVPVSGVPRMHGALRVAIVGDRPSAGILTDGKETRG
jgi:hypothetical protein